MPVRINTPRNSDKNIKITVTVSEKYRMSVKDFNTDTIQLNNKIKTNPSRQKTQHPGCYVFYQGNRCLYVGKSVNSVGGRILQHLRYADEIRFSQHSSRELQKLYKQNTVDFNIEFWRCDRENVGLLEQYLIKKLKPELNFS